MRQDAPEARGLGIVLDDNFSNRSCRKCHAEGFIHLAGPMPVKIGIGELEAAAGGPVNCQVESANLEWISWFSHSERICRQAGERIDGHISREGVSGQEARK
jgi:hypothetical protein